MRAIAVQIVSCVLGLSFTCCSASLPQELSSVAASHFPVRIPSNPESGKLVKLSHRHDVGDCRSQRLEHACGMQEAGRCGLSTRIRTCSEAQRGSPSPRPPLSLRQSICRTQSSGGNIHQPSFIADTPAYSPVCSSYSARVCTLHYLGTFVWLTSLCGLFSPFQYESSTLAPALFVKFTALHITFLLPTATPLPLRPWVVQIQMGFCAIIRLPSS